MNQAPLIAPSRRQRDVLNFIKKFCLINGFQPTRSQIAVGLGLSAQQSISDQIHALVRKGWLEGGHRMPRTLRLTHTGDAPVFDATTPVPPDEALRNDDRIIDRVGASIADTFSPRPDFFVRIDDADSAIDSAPADLLAIDATATAEPGTIVIGRIGDRVVCRRVQATGADDDEKLRIEGAVIGTVAARSIAA